MSHSFAANNLTIIVLMTALGLSAGANGQHIPHGPLDASVPAAEVAVYALTSWDPDGAGEQPPLLVAGGRFKTAGHEIANHIATWDGTEWAPLGAGVAGGVRTAVYALAVFDDGTGPALYVGGDFTSAGGQSANNIAKWDGATWSALGEGTSAKVRALHVFHNGSGPALRVGGEFLSAGDLEVFFIADWDGASWSDLENWSGSGTGTNGPVYAITSFEDLGAPALYVGGAFTAAGGMPANHVAKAFPNTDGTHTWVPIANGVNGDVLSLTIFNDGTDAALMIGGDFTMANSAPANHIARWDGNGLSAYTTGFDDQVLTLKSIDVGFGTTLFAGGRFASAGQQSVARIAELVGPTWSPLGAGMPGSGSVHALSLFDDGQGLAVFAGGSFKNGGGIGARAIAKWDGETWSTLGAGLR